MAQFRVHFTDGQKVDVSAATPDEAGKKGKDAHPGAILKIKLVKGK